MDAKEIEEMQKLDAETAFLVNTRLHNFLQHNRKELLELALCELKRRDPSEKDADFKD